MCLGEEKEVKWMVDKVHCLKNSCLNFMWPYVSTSKIRTEKKVKLGSYFNSFLWSWCCAQKLVLLFSHINALPQRTRVCGCL